MQKTSKCLKSLLAGALAVSVAVSGIPVTAMAAGDAVSKSQVTISNDTITVGNGYLTRTYAIADGKIHTAEVKNSRINSTLTPQAGSQDFVINTISEEPVDPVDPPATDEKVPTEKLDTASWSISIKNAAGTAFPDASAKKAIDGDLNTYPDEYSISGNPFTVDIDMKTAQTVSSFSVNKRPGYTDQAYGINGTMGEFEVLVSEDGTNYTSAGTGEFTEKAWNLHQEGNLYNVGDTVYFNLTSPQTVQYVRLIQKSCSLGTAQEFSNAEIALYKDTYVGDKDWSTGGQGGSTEPEEPSESAICSGDLAYKSAEQTDVEGGKKLTIHYAPYVKNDVTWNIDQVVVVKDADHYMRSFLEIRVSDPDKAAIDYIDTDRFVLRGDETTWCHPDDSKISSMWIGQHELMLGQPIYAEGMFFGCEFPANDNIIKDNCIQIRYYSGKNFKKLEEDNQLTKDGKFVTWQNVIGAAEGKDTSVVQTAFFSYIEDIATPTDFRRQYNSWYDNMMNITDESIAKSFYGAEEGLSRNGVEPLDCYVVDDGWNNYYYKVEDTSANLPAVSPGSQQGTTPNRTGFWEFNAKFPNELYTSSSLADKLASTFGVWVGPQGGYNYFGSFSQYLEYMGTGEVQSNSALGKVICTGSRTYLKNFEAMALNYQRDFDINYWKWDGFASRPCNNAAHNHMTGGDQNMYFTSDMWEAWTDLFDHVRAQREKEGKGLFINATCYVNLNPWLLQWVNTVWVQDSGDTGQLGTGERHQQKIYYRDQVYYQLYKQNQIQFPLKNIYNHDPIFGVSDGSVATTDVFREFLFANAVRGTAFWELYYSPSIMDDEKWMVTADALAWAEDNHEILKNAKLFGNAPKEGVYGYSCWNGGQGIVSFTNPLDTEQTFTLEVTDVSGADKSLKDAAGIQVYPYSEAAVDAVSYGDTISVTLKPHQTIIRQYGLTDTTAPKLVSAKVTGEKEITLKFDERIKAAQYQVNGAAAEARLQADYRTVVLTTEESLADGASVTAEVSDISGNKVTVDEKNLVYYPNGIIARTDKIDGKAPTYDAVADLYWFRGAKKAYQADAGLQGTGDFAIHTGVNTTATNVSLVKSGNDVSLSVNQDGFAELKVGNAVLTSEENVTTVTEKAHGTFGTENYVPTATETTVKGKVNDGKDHTITAVREANGLLKLYVDGKLSSSLYDKAHLNEQLTGGAIVIGADGFAGDLAMTEVLNKAAGYEEIPYTVEDVSGYVTPSHEKWTATACSECSGMSGDASAMAALDGDTSSWWHTNYTGGDSCTDPHWIAVDFGGEETFDKFIYVGRGASTNGSMKNYKLELKDKDGKYTTLIENGTFSADDARTVVELDGEYTAYGLRLTCLSTHNGQNFAAAVEIDVAITDHLMTAAELTAAKASAGGKAEQINPEDYTAEKAAEISELVNAMTKAERSSRQTWAAMEAKLDVLLQCEHKREKAALGAAASVEADGETHYICNACGHIRREAIARIAGAELEQTSYVYDGQAHKPLAVVKDSTGRVLDASDYDITYSGDAVAAGTYTATITFKGNYTGTLEKTFTIKTPGPTQEEQEAAAKEQAQKELSAAAATIKDIAEGSSDGYTSSAWAALQEAYAEYKKLSANPAATSAQLKAALVKLNAAKAALKTANKGDAVKSGYFSYKVLDTKKKTVAVVKGLKPASKTVKIPTQITLPSGKYQVTEVGANALKGYKKMTKLTIGKQVTKIGAKAFASNKKLTSITFSGTKVKTIGKAAFKSLAKKVTVKMPKKMKKTAKTKLFNNMKKKGGLTKKAKLK